MSRSAATGELMKALGAAQAKFKAIPKSADNPFFNSKFAPLPKIVEYAQPILDENGLVVFQAITTLEDREGALRDALRTTLYHTPSDQWETEVALLHLPKNDPQAQASATTYLRRYAYVTALGLQVDKDDDGNKGTQGKRDEEKKSDSNREELKALLAKSHPEAPDRKFFLEAVAGRKLKTSADLTDEEVEAAIAKLKGESVE